MRNSNLKILFFLSDLDGGGAQRTVINIVNQMTKQEINACLVVARSGGVAQSWLNKSVPLIDLRVRRTRHAVLKLRIELKRLRPSILFSTMVDANIIAALSAIGLRNGMQLILRETNSHRARGDILGLRRVLIKWAYRNADSVVALSSGVQKELLFDYGIAPDKLVTIGNPVDIEGLKKSSEAARQETVILTGDKVPIVIAIGRLTRQKGFDILIKAFSKVNSPAELIILGEGPDHENLLKLAEEEGIADRLSMPGFVSNPATWLANADVFVLSSRWEGFGHVLVEAMAAGVPVITTNCPHGPSDIVNNGRTGVIVEEGSSSAIATAIDDLLCNSAKSNRLKKEATKDIGRFCLENIVNEYLGLFKRIK